MNLAVCVLCVFLVPLATAGMALIHQGLGRSRSAAHSMLATLCALGVTAIVFLLAGAAWTGYGGGAAHSFVLGGRPYDWLGALPFFATGTGAALLKTPTVALTMALQMFAVGLAALVPLSAGTDRWRLIAVCCSSALLAAAVFPLFAHWVWGGGWLAHLTALFGLPPFFDAGGAGVIQVAGGLAALAVAWVLGPRQGKYTGGMAAAIPGHNIVLVLFGCLLALAGWIGLDSAVSMLFYGAVTEQLPLVAINAMLAASAGCLAAVFTTQMRYRKPDASLSANGWIAGLVAGSASSCFIAPLAAVFIGLVAGGLVTFLVETLELKLMIDDPGGAVSVHLGAGLWGLLAAGFFVPTAGPRLALLLSQMIGIATLVGFLFPLVYAGNLLLHLIVPYRVDADGDWQGMDIRELGAGAYPEFVMHADEFVPR